MKKSASLAKKGSLPILDFKTTTNIPFCASGRRKIHEDIDDDDGDNNDDDDATWQ